MADKFKFVKTRIDKLQYTGVNGKKQVFWDTDIPGARFGLYVTASGVKTYFAQGRYPNGKAAQTVIGRADIYSPEDAREKAREYLKLYDAGKNPKHVEKQTRAFTIETIFKDYLKVRKVKETSKNHYQQQFDTHLSEWKDLHPTDINRSMVMQKHAAISEKRQVKREDGRKMYIGGKRVADASLQLLGFIIDFAIDSHDDLLMKNPVRVLSKTKAYHGTSPREGYVKPDELKELFRGLNLLESDTSRDYILALLFTGGRADEVARLQIKDINLKGAFGVLRETKNGKQLWIPFCSYIMDVFKTRAAAFNNEPNAYLFPSYGKKGYLTRADTSIDRIFEATGITFTPHYFRRGYKTYAKNLKIDKLIVNRLQNHAMPSRNDMAEWYTQHEIEDLRPVVEQISEYILENAGVTQEGKE